MAEDVIRKVVGYLRQIETQAENGDLVNGVLKCAKAAKLLPKMTKPPFFMDEPVPVWMTACRSWTR